MLNRLPPFAQLRKAAHRRQFLDNVDQHLFSGSYESFQAATAAAPASKPIGFDNVEEARRLFNPQIFFYDYPALFWLGRSLEGGLRTVFDLGGHAGMKYYAFRRMLDYPHDLRWKVCDVPGVIQAGREIAATRGTGAELAFTTDFREASGFDVLFIAGCLQFLAEPITEILRALPIKPKRIILNTTAVHPERTIYTLYSLGFAFSPYRIQQHDELLSELAAAGYRRRDAWRNEGKPIEVPFIDGGDKPYYAGACFDLR